MGRRILAVLVIVACGAGPLAAQEHEEAGEHEALKRHQLALFTGYTWVPKGDPHEGDPEGTVIAPTIGIDYSFWISHKFGVGLYNDFELTSYVVQSSADTLIPREYAYVGSLVGIYEPVRGLELYAGPGVELEKNHNFFVFKVGFEYAFIRTNEWATGFAFGYDFKEEYHSWALGISVARRF
jgi:hypothetical protein